jgi:hypothetical protein
MQLNRDQENLFYYNIFYNTEQVSPSVCMEGKISCRSIIQSRQEARRDGVGLRPALLKRGARGRSCQPSGLNQRGARGMDGLGLTESLRANVTLHVADMDRLRAFLGDPSGEHGDITVTRLSTWHRHRCAVPTE